MAQKPFTFTLDDIDPPQSPAPLVFSVDEIETPARPVLADGPRPALSDPVGAPGRTDVRLGGDDAGSRPGTRLPSRLGDIMLSQPFQADMHVEVTAPMPRAPEPTWTERLVTDPLVTAAKSVVGVGESAVGLLDIPTMGLVGGALEKGLGYDPELTKSILNSFYSKKMQEGQAELAQSDGLLETAATVLRNPNLLTHSVLESLPLMAAGGAVARGLVAAGVKAGTAAAVGEGAVSAGMAAESARQQGDGNILTPKETALAVTSGAATGALGRLGNRIAEKLGIADVDSMIAGAATDPAAQRSLVRQVIYGAVAEGGLEELPQSVTEQVLDNAANDRPLDQGVAQSAVMGALAGAVMGGGAQFASRALAQDAPPTPASPAAATGDTAPSVPSPASVGAPSVSRPARAPRPAPTAAPVVGFPDPAPVTPEVTLPPEFQPVGYEPPPVDVSRETPQSVDEPLTGTVVERAAAMRAENPNIDAEAAEMRARDRAARAPEKINIPDPSDVGFPEPPPKRDPLARIKADIEKRRERQRELAKQFERDGYIYSEHVDEKGNVRSQLLSEDTTGSKYRVTRFYNDEPTGHLVFNELVSEKGVGPLDAALTEFRSQDTIKRLEEKTQRKPKPQLAITPTTHLDHGLSEGHIAFIQEKFGDRDGFFAETIELPEHLEPLQSALYGPLAGDPPIGDAETFRARRGDRPGESRLTRKPARPTRQLTVIGGKGQDGTMKLYTAFGGPLAPQEPFDPSVKDKAASEAFWREHALSAPDLAPVESTPEPEAPKENLYRPLLRPAGMASLPRGLKWDYAEVPESLRERRQDVPVSKHPHGVIRTERPLTAEEMERFDLAPVETEEPKRRKFSSTQLNLPPEIAGEIQQLAAFIPDDQLAADGRETEPHVTVKYGLTTTDAEEVAKVLADQPPIRVTFGRTSHFADVENGTADAIKVDVDGPELRALNAKIAEALDAPGDTHPEYKPHATIAYVKPGLGKDYDGDATLDGREVVIDRLVFSSKTGEKFEIPLAGKTEAAEAAPAERTPYGVDATHAPVTRGEINPHQAFMLRWIAQDFRAVPWQKGGSTQEQRRMAVENADPNDTSAKANAARNGWIAAPHVAGAPLYHTLREMGVTDSRPAMATAIEKYLSGEQTKQTSTVRAALKVLPVLEAAWNTETRRFDWSRLPEGALEDINKGLPKHRRLTWKTLKGLVTPPPEDAAPSLRAPFVQRSKADKAEMRRGFVARQRARRDERRTAFNPEELETKDVNEFGEEQARLPGDVGRARETETATPEVADVPFSLTPEVAETGSAQPTLREERDEPAGESWSTDALSRVFGFTSEVAAGIDALARSMGLDLSKIKLTRGNAKPTGDTLTQVDVNSPEFKRWFGDSKVVDPDGKPLVVYHGTPNAGFTKFKRRDYEEGYWFSSTPEGAEQFTGRRRTDQDPGTYAVYLSIKNPMVFNGWAEYVAAARAGGKSNPLEHKKYLRRSLLRRGYDGFVIRNSDSDAGGFRDDWVAFEPTQIKSAIANRGTFDPNDPNILHQERRRLSVIHNLSAENLIHADELGGLAVPSLAIVREDSSLGDGKFGNITLIGRESLADPAQEPVYDSDIYSIRHPKPEYPSRGWAMIRKLLDRVEPFSRAFDDYSARYEVTDGTDPDESVRKLERSPAMRAMYLKEEHGVTVEPVIVPKEIEFPWATDPEFSAAIDGLDIDRVTDEGTEQNKAFQAAASAAVRRWVAALPDDDPRVEIKRTRGGGRDLVQLLASRWGDDGAWAVSDAPMPYTTIEKIYRSRREAGETRVDSTATRERIDEKMRNREEGYLDWLRQTIYAQYGKPSIKVGGRKKPYTLTNIVEAMVSTRVKGREKTLTFGEGAARASAAHRITSMAEMRNRAEWQLATEEQFEELQEGSKAAISAWRDAVLPYAKYSDTWSNLDASMRAIAKAAQKGLTPANLRSALRSEDFVNVPNEVLEQGVAAAKLLLNSQVPYFEGKPQRAVRLSEFAGAVIPKSAPERVRQILRNHAVPFREYDTNERGSQAQAVIAFRNELSATDPGVLFQSPVVSDDPAINRLFQTAWHGSPHIFDAFTTQKIGTGEGAQAYGWGLYFAGRKDVARWYRDSLTRTKDYTVEGGGRLPKWLAERIQDPIFNAADRKREIDNKIADFERDIAAAEERIARKEGQYWNDESNLPGLRDLVTGLRNARNGATIHKPGRLYKVEIPEDFEYLDWDKDYKDQSQRVKDALAALGIKGDPKPERIEIREVAKSGGHRLLQAVIVGEAGESAGYQARYNPRSEYWEIHKAGAYNTFVAAAMNEAKAREMIQAGSEQYYTKNPVRRGRELYAALGMPKVASQALAAKGVAGIRYLDGTSRGQGAGSHNYVVFDERLVSIQEFEQGPKGSVEFFENGESLIRAFETADVSTVIHELAHIARRTVLNRQVPESLRRDITEADIQDIEEWATSGTGRWDVKAEEKFARGFERYVREGGPTTPAKLRSVFEKLARWMAEIYQQIAGSSIDIEISPRVRSVFDKLVTRQERALEASKSGRTPRAEDGPTGDVRPHREDGTFAANTELTGFDKVADVLDAVEADAIRRLEQTLYQEDEKQAKLPLERTINYAVVGAAKIARGAVTFEKFSEAMTRQFGKDIEPKLQEIYELATARAAVLQKFDPDDYFNFRRVSLSEAEKLALKGHVVETIVRTGRVPKERITFAEIRAEAEMLHPDAVKHLKEFQEAQQPYRAVRDAARHRINVLNREILEDRKALVGLEGNDLVEGERKIQAKEESVRELLNTWMRMRSEDGRNLAMHRMMADSADTWQDAAYWLSRAKRALGLPPGVDLPMHVYHDLRKILDEGNRRVVERGNVSEVKQQLALYMMRLEKTGWLEAISLLRKAGLLTGIKTHLRNIGGNLTFQVLEELSRVPAVFVDMTLAKLSGRRTVQGIDTLGVMRSAHQAATKGVAEAKQVLKKGATTDELVKAGARREMNTGIKWLDLYANMVFRTLTATDRVFKSYAFRRSMEEQAALEAINRGVSPIEVLANPPQAMVLEAIAAAEYATFNNENFLAKTFVNEPVAKLRKGGAAKQAAAFAIETIIPFANTPANLVARMIDYTIIGGGARAAVGIGRAVTKGLDAEQQRAIAQAVGRGTVGTAFMYLGWQLAAAGLMTGGAGDEDPADRAIREAAGRTPGSILGLGQWWQVNAMAPLGNIMVLGAGLQRQATKNLANELTRVGKIGATAVSIVLEQPMLRGMSDLLEALDSPGGMGEHWLASTAGSFVPTLVSDLAAAFDPYRRDARPDGLRESLWIGAQNRLPGFRNVLPHRIDVLGRDVPQEKEALWNPFIGSTARELRDDVVRELVRLDVGVGFPQRKPGEEREAYRQRAKTIGQAIERNVRTVIHSTNYREATDESKVLMLDRVIDRTRAQFRSR